MALENPPMLTCEMTNCNADNSASGRTVLRMSICTHVVPRVLKKWDLRKNASPACATRNGLECIARVICFVDAQTNCTLDVFSNELDGVFLGRTGTAVLEMLG